MTITPRKRPITGRQRSVVLAIDRSVYFFSKHWLAAFNIILLIYVGLPILAPVLMKAGLTTPARAIYTIYSPLCHQMTQRSFFLFGDQVAYPREIAGTNMVPIEAYIGDLPEFEGVSADNWPAFFTAARRFLGNEQMGYKMALCERDIGIYGFVLIGGLIYGLVRKRVKIKPLPLILFLIIGMGPIALDGFSQLFSYWVTPADGSAGAGLISQIQQFLPLRESPPALRALTGALFGLMLAWLAYPQINEGMKGTETDMGKKLRKAGESEKSEDTSIVDKV